MLAPSIYVQCSEAAKRLLDDPAQRIATSGPDGIFTELDVIFLGAREAQRAGDPWTEDDMRLATREASQIMGSLFRNGQAVRFGPVTVPGLAPDYMRVSPNKIVYASAEGPDAIHTPNGMFPRMTIEADNLTRPGRRSGTGRDDLRPWDEQNLNSNDPTPYMTAEQREILRLKAHIAALDQQLAEALAEVQRLRKHSAFMVTRDDVRAEVEQLLQQRLDGDGQRVGDEDRAA